MRTHHRRAPEAARATLRTIPLFLLGFVPILAQAPQNPNPQGVIRITVNLVQVDAVVTDGKGHQVTNLRPEDFEVLEDGRPQTITNFSYISVAAPAGGETLAKPVPSPGVPSVPPVRLRPDQVRRTIAIVVDDFHIRFENVVYTRQALRRFLDEDVHPGDLVAIVHTSGGLGALQQFTNDKRVLDAAIDRLHYFITAPCGGFGLQSYLAALEREYCARVTGAATLSTLDYVMRGLRDLPGRKSVILLSDELFMGYGDPSVWRKEMQQLVDAADRSSAVLYTMDTRGLPTLQLSAALPGLPSIWGGPGSVGPLPPRVATSLMDRAQGYLGSQGSMAYLAGQTGGIFVHDNNDLAGGMREIMDDLSGYYLIGYKPPADTFKASKNGRGYHQIQVKVKVRGLHVRSRTGFFGVPDEETQPVYRPREDQLRAAVISPFGTSGVRVELASQFVNEGRQESLARLWLHIDARDLTFQDAPNGTEKSAVDILGLAFGDNGEPVAGLDHTLEGSYQPSELDALRRQGVNYRMDVPIKDPGGYQLRVAVRNPISQRVGSASEFIEVPDLRQGRLTLSGIVLNRNTLGDKGPAVRRFQAGDRVSYELGIYNVRGSRAGRAPNLESRIEILRDGRLVSTQNPGAISQVPWDSRRMVMSGELTLGPNMASGDYLLQVTVTDKLEPKHPSSASQWIDFEIGL
jgi:VWFA-related protein